MGPLHIGIWAWVGRNGVSASMPGMGAHGLEFAESANGGLNRFGRPCLVLQVGRVGHASNNPLMGWQGWDYNRGKG